MKIIENPVNILSFEGMITLKHCPIDKQWCTYLNGNGWILQRNAKTSCSTTAMVLCRQVVEVVAQYKALFAEILYQMLTMDLGMP